MTHQDAPLAQCRLQRGAFVRRVACEHEVGARRKDLETQRMQPCRHRLALGDHGCAAAFEPAGVLHRGNRGRDRQPVQRVGVEAVLDPLEGFDQPRVAHGIADPQAGQRTRLRERPHDQQLRETPDQSDRRFAAEIDVGFVDQHDRVGVGFEQPLDLSQCQQTAGGRIGIGQHDAAVVTTVVVDPHAESIVERNAQRGQSIQPAVNRIEAVGDVRKQHRPAMIEQAEERVRQHFVGAVAHEHLRRLQAVQLCQRFLEGARIRVGIQAQRVVRGVADRRQHTRSGSQRMLVGIELDQAVDARLFAGHVGSQGSDHRAPEALVVGRWHQSSHSGLRLAESSASGESPAKALCQALKTTPSSRQSPSDNA